MKSKKVLTILLSLAIMVTFMPMMAFAEPQPGTPDTTGDHDFGMADDVYATYGQENVEILVEATCETDGIGIATCVTEHGGKACTATKNVLIAAPGHECKKR
jgi:hypothetical protein